MADRLTIGVWGSGKRVHYIRVKVLAAVAYSMTLLLLMVEVVVVGELGKVELHSMTWLVVQRVGLHNMTQLVVVVVLYRLALELVGELVLELVGQHRQVLELELVVPQERDNHRRVH